MLGYMDEGSIPSLCSCSLRKSGVVPSYATRRQYANFDDEDPMGIAAFACGRRTRLDF
jgi:hypothetical protein